MASPLLQGAILSGGILECAGSSTKETETLRGDLDRERDGSGDVGIGGV